MDPSGPMADCQVLRLINCVAARRCAQVARNALRQLLCRMSRHVEARAAAKHMPARELPILYGARHAQAIPVTHAASQRDKADQTAARALKPADNLRCAYSFRSPLVGVVRFR